MPYYIYKVKDDSGSNFYGLLQADSKKELKRKLAGANLFFISAHACRKEWLLKQRVSFQTLIMFTHRLTSLIEAGVPLLKVFSILWRQSEDKTIQLVVSQMRNRLEEGEKISLGLDDFPNVFSPLYRSLVRVGEASGVLVQVLRKLSEYLDYKAAAIARIKKAMLYPSIVIVFSILVVISMFMFVVPTFENVLTRLNVELPLLTAIILGISRIMRTWIFIVVVPVLGITGFFLYKFIKKTTDLDYLWDQAILKIPYFGKILTVLSLSQFTRSFSILLGAGVPILESFDVACTTANNKKIIKDIQAVKHQVESGTSIYESFHRTPGFPILLVEMIGVGESSGRLMAVLEKLTKHFDEESDYYINKFITLLEPMLLIVVGFIVIITLLAVYLPVIGIWQGLMNK